MKKFNRYLFYFFVLISAAGILIFPTQSVFAAREGIEICLNAVIPSLFPFLVICCIMINSGALQLFSTPFKPLMKPLFNLNKNCAGVFFLGLISGYPAGAKAAVSLYQNGLCSKTDGEKLLCFCNNTSPAFVIITVGIGIYKSAGIGFMLFLAQTLSAILTGIVFCRAYKKNDNNFKQKLLKTTQFQSLSNTFIDAVNTSSLSIIHICAFVIFFSVLIKLMSCFNIINFLTDFLNFAGLGLFLEKENISQLIVGFFEITAGVKKGSAGALPLAVTSAVLGWAGLCVHCQIFSFLQGSPFCIKPYILAKLFQSVSAAFITYIFALCFPFEKQVFLNFNLKSNFLFYSAIKFLNLLFILSLFFIFFYNFFVFVKKRYLLYKRNDV